MFTFLAIVSLYGILATLSEASTTLIVVQVVTFAGLVLKAIIDQLNRRNDRLDRESAAKINSDHNIELSQKILNAGEDRKNELLDNIKQVKSVAVESALKSQEAINVANGHNEKIANAVDISKQVLEKFSTSPLSVTVENDSKHPIPVEVENNAK